VMLVQRKYFDYTPLHRVQNHMVNGLAEGLMAHYEEVEDEGRGGHHRVE